jgi:hypothetical protein
MASELIPSSRAVSLHKLGRESYNSRWCTTGVKALQLYVGNFALFADSAYLSRLERANERTRTADLLQLRVCGHTLQGCAGGCKCRIFRGVSCPCLAERCTALRSRWYQSGIKRGAAASLSCSVVAFTSRTSSTSPDKLESSLTSSATLAGCLR